MPPDAPSGSDGSRDQQQSPLTSRPPRTQARRVRHWHVTAPDPSPLAAVEQFQRPEAPLVVHLAVALDPVAQVEVVEPLLARPLELPQDRQRAEPARRLVRIEERVDRRQRAFDAVGHRHGQQPAAGAELQEAAVRPRADQELLELRRAVVVHPAAEVAREEIAPVQRELFVGAPRRDHAHGDIGIAAQAAALAAVGDEVGHRHAHRHAGPAAAAVRAVDQVAGAAEAPAERLRIEPRQARVARIQHQVARGAVGKVAARVRAGVEHAQALVVAGRDVAHGYAARGGAAGGWSCGGGRAGAFGMAASIAPGLAAAATVRLLNAAGSLSSGSAAGR